MASIVRATSCGASPTDGSSTRRIRGVSISARASASICCSPPLIEPASWLRRSARRGNDSKQKSRLVLICARAFGRNAPSSRFSSTVSFGKSLRPSGTSAIPKSTMCSVLQPTKSCFSPSISAMMRPSFGRTMPITHFISVLLPLPLVPSKATVSPDFTEIETSSMTRTEPYAACTPSMVRLLAKISPHDFGIADNVFRLAVGNLLAAHQHDESLREAHHRAHDMFDQDNGDAALVELLEERENVLDFRMRQAGHRFVGDQKFRLRCDRASQLEFAHLNLCQIARHVASLVIKPNQTQ